MKKLLRTAISLALCAVLLLCAAAPAFALTENRSFIDYGHGVNVDCNSVLNSIRAKGTITLSFVPGVNHLSQGSYSCGVGVIVHYTNNGLDGYDPGDVSAMTTNTKVDHNNRTALSAEYSYRVNGETVYSTGLNFGS